MGLTTLPTTADDSVGRDKADRAPAPNLNEYITASEWNEVKNRVVEIANALGLGDGSTVGSVEEALLTAAPSLQFGRELMRWNKTDTSQFESTAFDHARSTGVTGGSSTLTVVNTSPFYTGNVLRVTYTNLEGGSMYPVLESELTLPDRYVIYVRFSGASTTSTSYAAVYVHCDPTAGAFNGALLGRSVASTAFMRIVHTDLGRVNGSISSSGALAAASTALGGTDSIITVEARPNGILTPEGLFTLADQNRSGGKTFDAIDTAALVTGNEWDNQDHNRVGPGAISTGVAASGSVDYSDFRVYAHPDD